MIVGMSKIGLPKGRAEEEGCAKEVYQSYAVLNLQSLPDVEQVVFAVVVVVSYAACPACQKLFYSSAQRSASALHLLTIPAATKVESLNLVTMTDSK